MGNLRTQKYEVQINCFGSKYKIKVAQNDTVESLEKQVKKKQNKGRGAHVNLLLNRKKLNSNRTLKQYEIVQGTVIEAQIIQLKDIGVFDLYLDSAYRHLFYLKDFDHQNKDEINTLIQSFQGDLIKADFTIEHLNIPDEVFKHLIEFADKKYQEALIAQSEHQIQDFQMKLTQNQLQNITGKELIPKLQTLFDSDYNEIIIRRCQAYGKFINFHTDVSLKTLQLALNDDSQYEGGRLMYVSGGKLNVPKRKKGTVTIHNNKIVHGVTVLESGTRYGLFLLKK